MLDVLTKLVNNGITSGAFDDLLDNLCKNDSFESEVSRKFCAFIRWYIENIEGATIDEFTIVSKDVFSVDGNTFQVLDDNEAIASCRNRVACDAWTFHSQFMASVTGLDQTIFDILCPSCESANDAILAIIKGSCGFDDFFNEVLLSEGRGHFLNHCGGDEFSCTVGDDELFIYQIS